MIVAVADNDVIGFKGGMPAWRQPADLARFKRLTTGHPIIVGRETFEKTLKQQPLDGRQNIVVTRHSDYQSAGVKVAHSVDEALAIARSIGANEVFVIGGGKIYEQTLPLATKIYLTRIHSKPEGDTWFKFNPGGWKLFNHEDYPSDDQNQYDYSFEDYKRAKA